MPVAGALASLHGRRGDTCERTEVGRTVFVCVVRARGGMLDRRGAAGRRPLRYNPMRPTHLLGRFATSSDPRLVQRGVGPPARRASS